MDEVTTTIRSLFQVVGGYRLHYIGAGTLAIDQGNAGREGMTALTLTALEDDLVVEKIHSTITVNEENPRFSRNTSAVDLLDEDIAIVTEAIARLQEVNRQLGEAEQ